MKKNINERMDYTRDKKGAIIRSDNYTPYTLKRFAHAYNKEIFDSIMKNGGDAREWMSRHPNFGYYVRHTDIDGKQLTIPEAILQARARWMGDESWYEEDNYFWIKLDEFDKPLICQLRISNHNASHSQYEKSHLLNKKVNCQTCLNVVIGSKAYDRDKFKPAIGQNAIIVVETLYNEKQKTQEQIDFFENFIVDLTSGKQPLLTIDDIRKNIDPNPRIVITQNGIEITSIDASIKNDQYTPRQNILVKRTKTRDFDAPTENKKIEAIKYDNVADNVTNQTFSSKKYKNGKVMPIFVYDNVKYAYDDDSDANSDFGYAIRIKDSGVLSKEPPIKIIENKRYNRNMKKIVRLTESDLHRIVKESVKKILTEGENWIGDYERNNFDILRQKVNECGGTCSFSLNGKDFTIVPSQRGFTITSGVDFGYDALNMDNALKAAWRFSNGIR